MRHEKSIAPRRARPVLERRAYTAPHYQSRALGRLIFVVMILLILAVVGAAGGLYWSLSRSQGTSSRPVTFQVASGDTVSSLATRLQNDGLIGNTLLFHLDARLQGLGGNLKAGTYTLRSTMSIQGMVAALQQHYTSPTIRITIREGLRKEQIAAILQRHGISGKQFLQAVAHPTFRYPIMRDMPRGAGLEGYLYPNTYYVAPHFGGKLFAQVMVRTLSQDVTRAMQQQAIRSGLGIYGVLKLASIVEREARMPSERPIIASVYANRLKIGMILNADPTVQYAAGHPGDWWPQLISGQEDANSPYNTYTHSGLPPTPICNPGLLSIKAALSPATTNYLYFVAKGNGYHAFAQTLAEQNANIAKYSQP